MNLSQKNKTGFTLIELIFVIATVGLALLSVWYPAIVAARSVGREESIAKLSLLANEEAEIASYDLSQLSEADWTNRLTPLMTASPFRPHPGKTIDGATYSYSRSITCITADLSTIDPACLTGYAKIIVTVTHVNRDTTVNVTFIKTRTSI